MIARPQEFAEDDSPTEAALIHTLEMLEAEGFFPEAVAVLEPTSPLRTVETIDGCIKMLLNSEANGVITVTPVDPLLGEIDGQNRFEALFPSLPRRRQERYPLYRESSTVYAVKVPSLLESHSLVSGELLAFVVDAVEAVDINEEVDLVVAEAFLRWRER